MPRSAWPERDPRRAAARGAARAGANTAGGSLQRTAKHFEREPRIAQRAADVQVVAGARAGAQQRLPGRHFAEHGDADRQRAARRVAAHQRRSRGHRPARAGRGRTARARLRRPRGSASARVKASGRAPQAARSLRFTASALWPSRCGSTVGKEVAAFEQQVGRTPPAACRAAGAAARSRRRCPAPRRGRPEAGGRSGRSARIHPWVREHSAHPAGGQTRLERPRIRP